MSHLTDIGHVAALSDPAQRQAVAAEWQVYLSGVQAGLLFLTLIATAWAAYAASRAVSVGRSAVKVAEVALRAANESAEAATRSAQAAVLSLVSAQRPFLYVTPRAPTFAEPQGARVSTCSVLLELQNVGREPAIVSSFQVQISTSGPPYDRPLPRRDLGYGLLSQTDWTGERVLPGSASAQIQVSCAITKHGGADRADIESGDVALYVFGLIDYRDFAGTARTQGFCFGLDQSKRTWTFRRIDGDSFNFEEITKSAI